jgi:glycine cleavage system H protein
VKINIQFININPIPMNIPENLYYTKEHEWLQVDGNQGIVGITDFAQQQLGDVVFVEVETVGETITMGDAFGTVEAVKTVSDLFIPITAKILELNSELNDQPELINKDPYGQGWIVKILLQDPEQVSELLNAEQYKAIAEG